MHLVSDLKIDKRVDDLPGWTPPPHTILVQLQGRFTFSHIFVVALNLYVSRATEYARGPAFGHITQLELRYKCGPMVQPYVCSYVCVCIKKDCG